MTRVRFTPIEQSKAVVADEISLLEQIQAVLEKEKQLARQINQLLDTRDYGDQNRTDIVQAKLRMHHALQAQQDSREALRRGIESLSAALELLGRELES